MRRLIFINRFFFPDHSATSQILSDLAFHLAGTGREVHVITGSQVYDDPRASLPAHEIIRGVGVHRVLSTRFGRAGLLGRAVDYGSFYLSAWHSLAGLARRDDIIVAETDPPLISVVAMAAARRSDARLVNWLQDVYPEVAVELGVPFVRGPVAAALAALRTRSLQQAAANVVVGDLMGAREFDPSAFPRRGSIPSRTGATTRTSDPSRTRTIRCVKRGAWRTNSSSVIRAISGEPTRSAPCCPPPRNCAATRACFS